VTGKAAGHVPHESSAEPESSSPALAADALEVSPGWEHEKLEGWVPALASEEETCKALEKAFDYRGDVTITRKDGTTVEGYVFDRKSAPSLAESIVRVLPRTSNQRVMIPYSDIAALAFTGRDTAAGKSWEAWVKKYREKRAAGEKDIGLEPEALE
jgi:hypothetical protein